MHEMKTRRDNVDIIHGFYLEQRFEFQGFCDLYAYATQHGPFMISEIGSIAHQLLWRLRDLHERRMLLKFLAPQYVVVTHGFTSGYPELEIVGVE